MAAVFLFKVLSYPKQVLSYPKHVREEINEHLAHKVGNAIAISRAISQDDIVKKIRKMQVLY